VHISFSRCHIGVVLRTFVKALGTSRMRIRGAPSPFPEKFGGLKMERRIQGGSDFRTICGYVSETVIVKGIVTMEDEYKVVCALSNGATLDDLE